MKVLVNAVAARLGGGVHHLNPFVVGMADAMPDSHFDVFVTADLRERSVHDRVAWREVDVPQGISVRRLLWDNVTVARMACQYDAVLSPLNFGPIWCPVPHVLFQRNALYFDRRSRQGASSKLKVRLAGYRWLAVIGSNTAARVLVPSEAMAALVRPYVLDRRKVLVARHGINVRSVGELALRPLPPQAQKWARCDVKLLHVGHASRHKDLDCLAQVVANVVCSADRAVGLAVTIPRDDASVPAKHFAEAVAALGVADHVHWLGAVAHEDIFSLYAAADVLVLPSKVESFGFPVLEAFATGTAVVASDLPAIAEIAGGQALLHAPGDADLAAALVAQALSSESLNRSAVRRCRAAFFDRDKQVEVVAEALRGLPRSR